MLKKVLILVLIFAGSYVRVQAQIVEPPTLDQAKSHLLQLTTVYPSDLTSEELADIKLSCLETQKEIALSRTKLTETYDKHWSLFTGVKQNVGWLGDELRDMQEDSSVTDLAYVKLESFINQYSQAVSAYAKILDETVIINCSEDVNLFVAGMQEIAVRQRLVAVRVQDIIDYGTENMNSDFDSIRSRAQGFSTGVN